MKPKKISIWEKIKETFYIKKKNFTCQILITSYSHIKDTENYCRIWYKYEMDNLISNDKDVTMIDPYLEKKKSDYCNISKFSNTSYKLYSFKTEIFDYKDETHLFLNEFNCIPMRYNNLSIDDNKLWYVKPVKGSQGKGIMITSNPNKYQNEIDKYLIEESINMRLKRGRRWDMRLYVYHTINSKGKLSTYLYNDGLVRLCPDKFNIEKISKRNMCSNTSQYKNKDLKNKLDFSLTELEEYNMIMNKVKILLSKIHKKMQNKIIYKNEYLLETQLMGYDFIIDKNNKLYLIEINNFPQYITTKNSEEIKIMKKKLIKDVYSLIKSYYLDKQIPTNFVLIN